MRTFAFISLSDGLGGAVGEHFALLMLALTGMRKLAIAMMCVAVTGFVGVLLADTAEPTLARWMELPGR